MKVELGIGKEKREINDFSQLKAELDSLKDFEEVSISGHGETTLLILFNPKSSFMVYFRFQDGDHGFHSFNLSKSRTTNEEFILSNGQEDLYPQHFLRSREEGKEAIFYYYKTGHMTPKVDWVSGPLG